jgi:hypothetical protein
MPDVVVRRFQPGDGLGISRISLENGAYYARIAPEHFKQPDAEGLAEMIEEDPEWRESDANLALVAEVTGEVAGYLEASVQPPMETARWQSQSDLADPRSSSTTSAPPMPSGEWASRPGWWKQPSPGAARRAPSPHSVTPTSRVGSLSPSGRADGLLAAGDHLP